MHKCCANCARRKSCVVRDTCLAQDPKRGGVLYTEFVAEVNGVPYTVAPEKIHPVAMPVNGGAHASYYELKIAHPKSGAPAYMAECQDIIEALKMDFNEGNAFKALWRRAAARLGKVKKGNDDTKYDADKIAFYGERIRLQEERKRK